MERFKPLLFCALFIWLYFPSQVAAENNQIDIEAELAKIAKISDKSLAIIQLQQLLSSNELAASQRYTLLVEQGKLFFAQTDYHRAIAPTLQAAKLAQQNNLAEKLAQANKLLGVFYYFLGEYAQALNYYQLSLQYYQNLSETVDLAEQALADNAISRANLHNNIALVYSSTGNSTLALESYQQAEPLYQAYGDDMDKIDIRYNIAALHINLKRFDIAINMLKEVIVKRNELADEHGVASARADLGVAYKDSGQYELAKQHVMNALNYFQQRGDKFNTASQLHNISEVFNELQQADLAIDYAKQAIELSKEISHQRAYAGALQSLAKAYFYQGELQLALENITLSTQVASKLNYKSLHTDNLAWSALIMAAQQNYIQASKNLNEYENEKHNATNAMLNEHLARFESEQLSQQVFRLEQNKKLHQLQLTKAEQQRKFILIALVLLLVLTFLMYRRHLEARITKELEARVTQRTLELEALTKELQQANQIKSQFLANMSHEIRTPLTAIVGQAEAIISGDVEPNDLAHEVDIIHGNSLHLLHLINEILDLSKIEANKLELEVKQYNLHCIINDLVDIFKDQAVRKGLLFTVEENLVKPFYLNIDGFRLKQILINLCANAIKFTEHGEVKLTFSWQQGQLYVQVIDTGIGMSAEQIEHIFELFSQADNSISRRFGGSGLGLYLSNQLAVLMSGSIRVESELAAGSKFQLTLPCQQSELAAEFTHYQEAKQESLEEEAGLFSGKIILADDHYDNRRLIARLLSSIGLEVISASNGIEAVELALEHQAKLLLLDIQMPEMDGIEALTKLRSLGYQGAIYALTANAMSHEIEHYMSLGFDGHLKKPIEREQFISVIRKYYQLDKHSDVQLSQRLATVELADLANDFTQNLSQDRALLQQCTEAKDYNSAGRLVHKIAGAAQMFGYVELSQLAMELELKLKDQPERTAAELATIQDLLSCLFDEISVIEHKAKGESS